MTRLMISAVILTYNNEDVLKRALDSLKAFDEVVLIDNGSTDQTLSIAHEFENVSVYSHPFTSFGELRNMGAQKAKSDWILALDSDEELSPQACEALQKIQLDPSCAYAFPRHNFFNGKWIKTCGWHPDWIPRLYHKKRASFTLDLVHERLDSSSVKIAPLPYPLFHYSYRSISDFSRKLHFYSDLFAEQNAGKKNSSMVKALTHGAFAFFKSYILKRGVLQGKEGYIISSYNGECAYYKYLKLSEKNSLKSR